jgi:substrate import-associated zinc metallohydrolase lipoprotein
MKRLLKYITVALLGTVVFSCSDDSLESTSILNSTRVRDTDFDKYLYREFLLPYNLQIKYWFDDNEEDQTYQLLPATLESSKIMAVLLKHLWLDVYSEASPEGIDFDRKYAVRLIQLVGSGGYNPNSTVRLGFAEGGKKIVLNNINVLGRSSENGVAVYDGKNLDANILLSPEKGGDFHTIHHEFCHILNQMKNYSEAYEQISNADYVGDSWNQYELEEAIPLGFITKYARMNKDEDFVEIFSTYITQSQEQWDARISGAGAEGKAKFAQKLELVREYIKTSWGMDLDNIRAIILRRASQIKDLDYVNLR